VSGPTVPVDDAALSALEHALGAYTEIADDDTRILRGADYTLQQLLNFWSGYDLEDGVLTGYIGDVPVYSQDKPCLSELDVIRALITEVRRLRQEAK
jgi:hypothetical protein